VPFNTALKLQPNTVLNKLRTTQRKKKKVEAICQDAQLHHLITNGNHSQTKDNTTTDHK
jgi:hypothetical protein